jgi:hypothetical protein
MNEQQIRKIVDDEIQKKLFQLPKLPPHKHNGTDNIKIPADGVIPSTGAIGLIKFARAATYTLYFTSQNPTRIDVNGFALNAGVTSYGMIVGNAILKPAYYFQPNNTSSVRTGGLLYPIVGPIATPDTPRIAQCCSSLLIDQSTLNNTFPTSNQFRAIFVDTVGGVTASGYFNNLTNNSIDLVIEVLASGWTINLNILIT